jgi:hypothetical protein
METGGMTGRYRTGQSAYSILYANPYGMLLLPDGLSALRKALLAFVSPNPRAPGPALSMAGKPSMAAVSMSQF